MLARHRRASGNLEQKQRSQRPADEESNETVGLSSGPVAQRLPKSVGLEVEPLKLSLAEPSRAARCVRHCFWLLPTLCLSRPKNTLLAYHAHRTRLRGYYHHTPSEHQQPSYRQHGSCKTPGKIQVPIDLQLWCSLQTTHTFASASLVIRIDCVRTMTSVRRGQLTGQVDQACYLHASASRNGPNRGGDEGR